MADRGGEWFEYEGDTFWWRRCEVAHCENFICVGRSDKWCWPHLMSGGSQLVTKRKKKRKAPRERARTTA